MDMRLENMRDSEPGFACHLNINLNVSSRIENRSDSFVILPQQVREWGDAFGLNGFKNERHRDDLTRSENVVQVRNLHRAAPKVAPHSFGTHRAPLQSYLDLNR